MFDTSNHECHRAVNLDGSKDLSRSSIPPHLLFSRPFTSVGSSYLDSVKYLPRYRFFEISKTTSICYCGAVQISYFVEGDNLVDTVRPIIPHSTAFHANSVSKFICNARTTEKSLAPCSPRISFSQMTLSITSAAKTQVRGDRHHRNRSHHDSYFCTVCGSLMYRPRPAFLEWQL